MKLKMSVLGLFLAALSAQVSAQGVGDWYYRAGIGYAIAGDAEISDKTQDPAGATSFANLCDGSGAAGSCSYQLNEIGNSVALSLGAGYRYNDHYRMEVNLSHRGGFKLEDSIASNFGGRDVHTADITVMTLMATGYYDFALQNNKYQPYVGAGLGIASNEIGTTTVVNSTSNLSRSHSGATETGLAWQLVAGVAIPMQNKMILDISYQYVDAGDLDSGSTTISGTSGGTPFGPSAFDGTKGSINFHEVSVGLRF